MCRRFCGYFWHLFGSKGSTRMKWKLLFISGKASSSLKLPRAFIYWSFVSGPTTGALRYDMVTWFKKGDKNMT